MQLYRLELGDARAPGCLDFELAQHYSPPEVDRILLWVYYTKIPIYTIFYLPKGNYRGLKLETCCIGASQMGSSQTGPLNANSAPNK